jgi:hypothetical protein
MECFFPKPRHSFSFFQFQGRCSVRLRSILRPDLLHSSVTCCSLIIRLTFIVLAHDKDVLKKAYTNKCRLDWGWIVYDDQGQDEGITRDWHVLDLTLLLQRMTSQTLFMYTDHDGRTYLWNIQTGSQMMPSPPGLHWCCALCMSSLWNHLYVAFRTVSLLERLNSVSSVFLARSSALPMQFAPNWPNHQINPFWCPPVELQKMVTSVFRLMQVSGLELMVGDLYITGRERGR